MLKSTARFGQWMSSTAVEWDSEDPPPRICGERWWLSPSILKRNVSGQMLTSVPTTLASSLCGKRLKSTAICYYVIEDLTCNEPPAVWASRAVNAYHRHKADRIVAERNFGGAMVEAVVKNVGGKPINYGEVIASRGKVVRAEPISSFYAQGLVSHADLFPELEDQMSADGTTAGLYGRPKFRSRR